MNGVQQENAFNWYLEAFRKYATFQGRTQRRGYWYFVLFNFLASIICVVIDYALAVTIGLSFVDMLYGLATLIPSLALGARRLHDIGKSGWWQLIALIPIIGWIILIVWMATESAHHDNQYGPYVR